MKKVLTGLQPTGVITLGNYIGAIQQMKDYQENYDSYIFIADLHAITVAQDPEELKKNIQSLIALYIAGGIEPEKNVMYLQSDIEYIPCVSWLLECNSYYGELSRMTQFKDKSLKHANFTSGLLTYPVLMTADIIGADADFVPVGGDQKQHVELARDIAIRFNKKYGDTFVIPEPLIKKVGTKIMDLQNPTVKMSKSAENKKGVILMLDDVNVTRKKIMSATTDSEIEVRFDMENKPGISNLINIYSSLTGMSIEDIESEFKGCNYGTFKGKVADTVVAEIQTIQDKYNEVIGSDYLADILDSGAAKMREVFKKKYEVMREKIGLVR